MTATTASPSSAAAPRATEMTPMFLTLNGRRLFALQVAPRGAVQGTVLYLPPFAEEMNRCRNHVAATARALAARGQRVLLLDLYGTGESDGQIAEPDWGLWRDDAVAAARGLHADAGGLPLTLWGLRTGALLAADVAAAAPELPLARLLFWQPVLDGKTFINQHLRLRMASQLVHDGDRETSESLRARLAAGEPIEVAGYPLSGAMADSLGARRIGDLPSLARQPLAWIDVVTRPDQKLALPSQKLVDSLRAAGGQVEVQQVVAPQIWQTNDREHAPALLDATVAAVCPVAHGA